MLATTSSISDPDWSVWTRNYSNIGCCDLKIKAGSIPMMATTISILYNLRIRTRLSRSRNYLTIAAMIQKIKAGFKIMYIVHST